MWIELVFRFVFYLNLGFERFLYRNRHLWINGWICLVMENGDGNHYPFQFIGWCVEGKNRCIPVSRCFSITNRRIRFVSKLTLRLVFHANELNGKTGKTKTICNCIALIANYVLQVEMDIWILWFAVKMA